jgi:hypothetical protein
MDESLFRYLEVLLEKNNSELCLNVLWKSNVGG